MALTNTQPSALARKPGGIAPTSRPCPTATVVPSARCRARYLAAARPRDSRVASTVGCAALKFHGSGPAEVKRMWVADSVRGLGVGRRLLGAVEEHAQTAGVRTLRLETNRSLGEAIALYRSAGFREVPAFNDEPFADHWFEKHLDAR